MVDELRSLKANLEETLEEFIGAKIPRETLANWCITTSSDCLYPVYEILHNELIHRDIIFTCCSCTCRAVRMGPQALNICYHGVTSSKNTVQV